MSSQLEHGAGVVGRQQGARRRFGGTWRAAMLGLALVLTAPAGWAQLGASVSVENDKTDIAPGESTTLLISLTNSDESNPISGVTWSDVKLPGTLPNALVSAGAPTFDPGSCGGTVAFDTDHQTLDLSGAQIPAKSGGNDGLCVIRVPVTAGTSNGAQASHTFNIPSGKVTGTLNGSPVQNQGSVNQTITVKSVGRPTLNKTFGGNVYLNGKTPLTLTVSNPSNGVELKNFSIADVLPDNITGVSVDSTSNCTASLSSDNKTVQISGDSLAAGATCEIEVTVQGAQLSSTGDSWTQTNTLEAADFKNDIGIQPAANATADIRVRNPLAVTKSRAAQFLADGQKSSFTITLTNNGPEDLVVNNFKDDPIDGQAGAGLTVDTVSATCTGTGAAGNFVAAAGDRGIEQTSATTTTIASGGSCEIEIGFTGHVQTAGNPVTYTNQLNRDEIDVRAGSASGPKVRSSQPSASVIVGDDLRVTKAIVSPSDGKVAPGSVIGYAVTVQNFTANVGSNLTITDPLGGGQTFISGMIDGHDYSPSVAPAACGSLSATGANTGTATFTIDTLPARTSSTQPGQCVVTFYAMTNPDGTLPTNAIGEGGVCYTDGANAERCNGSGSNSVGGSEQPLLEVNKSYNLASPQPEGAVVRARIELVNWAARAVTATVADDLPGATGGGQMALANPPNATSTCGSGWSLSTATAGSESISLNNATVPARAGNGFGAAGRCVLEFDVVAGAGSYDNTASVSYSAPLMVGENPVTGTLTDTETFVFNSALEVEKSFNPTSVANGGRSTVTLRVRNTDVAPMSGVSINDTLPAGMTVAPQPNAYGTCSGPTVVNAVAGASLVQLGGANLAPSSYCDLVFDVVADGSSVNGGWTNTINAGDVTADGGIKNQSPVSKKLDLDAGDSITVGKSTNPPSLTSPGQVSKLTITVTNGTTPVTGLALTDYFTMDGSAGSAPNGMRVASPPGASTTCPGGQVTADAGAERVSLAGVSLGAGAACTVTVNVTSTVTGGVTNYIPPGNIQTDQGLSNAGEATTSLSTSAGLGVTKQFTPNVVQPNQRARLRITINNPTTRAVSKLAFTDTLPAGLQVAPGPNPQTTCQGAAVTAPAADRVSLTGGVLGASASCWAEIDVVAAAAGDYVNTIPAGGLTGESNGEDVKNDTPTTDTLQVRTPLLVHKAFAKHTLDTNDVPAGWTGNSTANQRAGDAFELIIRLENADADPLTGVAFTDALPQGVFVADPTGAATTCGSSAAVFATVSGTSVRLSGGTVPANDACEVTVNVLSNSAGTYTNTIETGAVTSNEGVSNGEPTRARAIISAPPTVAKEFSPAVIPANGTSRLTIVLGNAGNTPMTLTSALVDNLPQAPGSMKVAAAPNIGGSCPGAVTAAAGSTSVTYATGATIPAGGCTIEVDVTADLAGTYNNNIPAGALKTDAGNNSDPANAPLKVSTLGYISGRVFADNDVIPNGTFEPGDTPLAGQEIRLLDAGGDVVQTTLTDALGNYLFTDLAAGSYTVVQPAQPDGTLNGITTAGPIQPINGSGGTQGTGSNPSGGTPTSQIAGIVLDAALTGEVSGSVDNNFAEIIPSSISGKVFVDNNNDGAVNGADTGIPGQEITLTGTDVNGNTVTRTTTTDAGGNYRFDDLPPGTYTVTQPGQPDGTSNGKTMGGAVPNGGTSGTGSNPDVSSSVIADIVLPPNTQAQNNNFAELSNGGRVSGTVFLDHNNNGVLDGSPEHGIGGETLVLTGKDINGNDVSRTTTTNPDGSYSFDGLPDSDANGYTITQPNQPAGTSNGQTTCLSAGCVPSGPGVTPSSIANVVVDAANRVSVENNFAEIPGDAPDLTLAKTHSPQTLGAGSSTGYYTITAGNIGAVATSGTITVVDVLPPEVTAHGLPSGSGWNCTVAGQTVTCTSGQVIAPGASASPIMVPVKVVGGAPGQVIINPADVSGGGEPDGFSGNNHADDPTVIAESAAVEGHVWRDLNSDRVLDGGEQRLPDWTVELLLNGNVVATTVTDAAGHYAFEDVAPGSGYEIRFREPGSGEIFGRAVPNEQGLPYGDGAFDASANPGSAHTESGNLSGLTLAAGTRVTGQSLPLDPSGVVYDAVTREPVAGAVVTIQGPPGFDPATHLLGGGAGSRTTGPDGMYQFILLPGAPTGDYTLSVIAPSAYVPGPSTMLPACSAALGVGVTPDPAKVQNSPGAPAAGVDEHDPAACSGLTPAGQATTQYYLTFSLTPGQSADVIHNHIPLDPILGGAIVMTKTTPLMNVTRGDLVPYTVTATNTLAATLSNIEVQDQIPPGFRYRTGSANVDGVPAEPSVAGRQLTWSNQTFAPGQKITYKLVLVVGAGVGEGDYVNQAWALNGVISERVSNIASATVRVVPDPTFDCSDIIGTVFEDKNANGYQDQGEPGIPNVRVVTVRGLLVTTDAEGRFHVSCADIPQMDRGSNFVMKLDERTLPSGFRVTTENPRDVRVTRGKMVKLNFGATVHRVVRVELDGRAFAEGQDTLQAQWQAQLPQVVQQLQQQPSVLRLAYREAEGEESGKRRLKALKKEVEQLYREARDEARRQRKAAGGEDAPPIPPLIVEIEVFKPIGGAK